MKGHLITRRINAPVTVKVEGVGDVQIVAQPDGAHQYVLSMHYDTARRMGVGDEIQIPVRFNILLHVGAQPIETYNGILGLIPGEEETGLIFLADDNRNGENLSLRIQMPTRLFLEELK